MINYGLQYQELMRKTIDAVTSSRLELADAVVDLKKAERQVVVCQNIVNERKKEMEAAQDILKARMERTPQEAVEKFKNDTGSYPL